MHLDMRKRAMHSLLDIRMCNKMHWAEDFFRGTFLKMSTFADSDFHTWHSEEHTVGAYGGVYC